MKTGFLIALAWPETLCKRPDSWYDGLANTIGLSKNHYYKVGHAALVLVEKASGELHYFDFGRYHAPYGHGRVRCSVTDHDLKLNKSAEIEGSKILNLEEILSALYSNPACHGTGALHASYTEIEFEKAYQYVKEQQLQSPIKYGPFIRKGTNCSRFVRKVALNSNLKLNEYFKLAFPKSISPTPISNVKSLKNYTVFNANATAPELNPQLA